MANQDTGASIAPVDGDIANTGDAVECQVVGSSFSETPLMQ